LGKEDERGGGGGECNKEQMWEKDKPRPQEENSTGGGTNVWEGRKSVLHNGKNPTVSILGLVEGCKVGQRLEPTFGGGWGTENGWAHKGGRVWTSPKKGMDCGV